MKHKAPELPPKLAHLLSLKVALVPLIYSLRTYMHFTALDLPSLTVKQFITSVTHLFIFIMGLHTPWHMGESEDNVWAFFPSVVWDPGFELGLSG